jgi:hypothetical protein
VARVNRLHDSLTSSADALAGTHRVGQPWAAVPLGAIIAVNVARFAGEGVIVTFGAIIAAHGARACPRRSACDVRGDSGDVEFVRAGFAGWACLNYLLTL